MALYNFISKNLLYRTLSALVLIPLTVFLIKLGGMYFTMFIMLIVLLMGSELCNMIKTSSKVWKVFAAGYVLISCFALLWIMESDNGRSTVLSIFILVWASDIGGYIFGKLIGGWKVNKAISPNKTWAGVLGGVIFAILASFIVSVDITASIIVSIIAQLGDFFESWVKRKFEVKDSGGIIPGHGGVFDRLDGVMAVAIFVLIVELLAKFGVLV